MTETTTIGYNSFSASYDLQGYVDEFRSTNAARYNGSATVPTAAFPNP
jgi:hypothetical protein